MKSFAFFLLIMIISVQGYPQSLVIQGDELEVNEFKTKSSPLYYLKANHIVALKDSIQTFNTIILNFSGLKGDSVVNIALIDYKTNSSVVIHEDILIPSSGNLNLEPLNVSDLGIYGSFYVQVYTSSYTIFEIFLRQPIFIEKAITISIPENNEYKFMIHYADNYISSPTSVFVEDYVANALLNSWKKEVIEWNLCEGLPGNIPQNNDSTYDIYIHNVREILNGDKFNDQMSSSINDGQREIFVDYNPISYCNADTTQITEKELLYLVISHEFFHGIQFSHMSLDSIIKNSYPNHKQEINNRKWLIEGQAKFLETVFMEDYSTSANNAAYIKNSFEGSYSEHVHDFILEAFDIKHTYPGLHELGYEGALFWRHLHEHNYDSAVPNHTRLALLRETCKAYGAIDSSSVPAIESFMDTELLRAGGHYNSLDNSIADFAEKTYFRSAWWEDTLGQQLNYWEIPNGGNYYQSICLYLDDISLKNLDPDDISSDTFCVPNNFAFKSHVINLKESGDVKLTFYKDPEHDGQYADFMVYCYVIKGNVLLKHERLGFSSREAQFNTYLPDSCEIVLLASRADNRDVPAPTYKIRVQSDATVPYIKEVIVKDKNGQHIADFSRTLSSGSFTFSNSPNVINAKKDIEVTVTTSQFLNQLTAHLRDKNGVSSYTITLTPAPGERKKSWTFTIPDERLASGLNTLCFTGLDKSNNALLKTKEPPGLPRRDGVSTWDMDTTGLTGTDSNYYFLLIPEPGPGEPLSVHLINDCSNGIHKAFFMNNENYNMRVGFGDGQQATILPGEIHEHVYSNAGEGYKVNCYSGSKRVHTRLIYFSSND